MFSMIRNLTRATISVAVTPIAVVVDVLTLPASAEYNKPPFGLTEALLKNAGKCVKEAVTPDKD